MKAGYLALSIWLGLTLSPSARETGSDSLIYVSLAGEKIIRIYRQSEETGALAPLADVPVDGEPGYLSTNRSGTLLLAAWRSTGSLATYRIPPETGIPELISKVSGGSDPAYVTLDRSETFLLSAYYRAGRLGVHRLGEDGAIDAESARFHPTARNAHAVRTDPSNQWLLVPHTGPDSIHRFGFDSRRGVLEKQHAITRTEAGSGPRHLRFHPELDRLYVNNEQGSGVSVFRFEVSTGRIEHQQTLITLPEDFSGGNTCADLEITPDARFLYCSNRGHDSIAAFRILPGTGQLEPVGVFPTETTPRSFALSPSGRWLIVAGQNSNRLQVFAVDPGTGLLQGRHRMATGRRPWAVLALRPER